MPRENREIRHTGSGWEHGGQMTMSRASGWQDMHHSNGSTWKPKEVPLGDDRVLVLDAD